MDVPALLDELKSEVFMKWFIGQEKSGFIRLFKEIPGLMDGANYGYMFTMVIGPFEKKREAEAIKDKLIFF